MWVYDSEDELDSNGNHTHERYHRVDSFSIDSYDEEDSYGGHHPVIFFMINTLCGKVIEQHSLQVHPTNADPICGDCLDALLKS